MALEEADLARIPDREPVPARASQPDHVRKVIDLTDGHEPQIRIREGGRLPSETFNEGELVEASREGDHQAFALLYDRYRRRLFKSCYRWTKNRAVSDDLVQDTFIRAFTCLDGFRRGQPFLPWLQSIARNRWIDIQRRETRRVQVSLEVMAEEQDDEASELNALEKEEDPAWEAIVRADNQAEIRSLLRDLTPRQKRVLLLFGLEDWSYRDIASAEGMSVEATKSLLFRARAAAIRAREAGPLGILLFPIGWLRRLAQRTGERVRRAAETPGVLEATASASMQQIAAGLLALTLSMAGGPATSSSRAIEVAADVSTSHLPAAPLGSTDEGSAAAASPTAGGGSDNDLVERAVSDVVDPNKDVRDPEDTQVKSIVFSPDYDTDTTLFLAGTKLPCSVRCPPVLFRSLDGGGTWERLRSEGLQGDQLLLPPSFGHEDDRIFAMGDAGLQVSEDGGVSFSLVTPMAGSVKGSAAIAPNFSKGNPKIVIGADALVEYLDDRKAFVPSLHSSIPGPLEPSFSPDYAQDGLMVIGGSRYFPDRGKAGMVFRCTSSLCDEIVLGGAVPRLSFSPRFATDRTVFAFGSDRLFVSRDGARSFEQLSLPLEGAALTEVAVASDGSVYASLFGVGEGSPSGLYVSRDLGRSWDFITHPLLGGGVRSVSARDAQIVVGGRNAIACSADAGSTWHRRCTPA